MPAVRRTTGLLLGLSLVFVMTAASCGDKQTGVSVGTVGRGTVSEIVEAPGAVTARAAATVSAPAAGTLSDLLVGSGDRVGKGQTVAVIDSPATLARRDAAREALDQASRGRPAAVGDGGFAAARQRTDRQASQAFDEARAAAAKVTDPAVRAALGKQITAAEQQYDAASQAAGAAERSLRAGVASLADAVGALTAAQRIQAEQAYELADAAVDALTLRAPVAGVVQLGGQGSGAAESSLSALLDSGKTPAGSGSTLPGVDSAVPEGAYVAAGTPILTVVDVGRLGITAQVDETDVLLVKAGGQATVELDAATGASYPAKVRAVDLLPTTSARGGVSYQVRLDLAAGKSPDGGVAPTPRPGMSAVVRLQVRQATDALTVPASAIVNADGRDTVWVVRGGRFQRVPVTLGVQGEEVVQVTAGVDAGQRIVVAGTDQVRSGEQAS
jgi:HlyD family secretion protein